jgi:tetratricopeptide (TPR) repeat protein
VTEAAREWSRVDKTSIVELETFLRRHGSSPEAEYARARVGDLRKNQAAITMPSPPSGAPIPAADECKDFNKVNADPSIADLSIKACTQLIASDRTPGWLLYYNRGSAYNIKKDYDRAIIDYTKVIEIHPKNQPAYIARAFAHGRKRDYDRAIADFSKAIEIDPKNATAYLARGDMWAFKGDRQRAITDYRQVLAIDPTRSSASEGLKRLGLTR